MNKLIDLPTQSLEYMLNDHIVMIDIRREDEWLETGVIKNAHLMTFFDNYGNHNAPNWLKKLEKLMPNKNTTLVLICAHANRTQVVGNYLIEEFGYTNVTHLKGGMALWIKEERETIPYI